MNDVSIALKISGFDFDPKEISKIVHLTPNSTHIKGETFFIGPPKNRIPKIRETNYWEYRVNIVNNEVWIKEIVDQFIVEVIQEKKDEWNKIIRFVDMELYIRVQYDSLEGLDSYYFENKTLKLLNDLNISIDIDQYGFRI